MTHCQWYNSELLARGVHWSEATLASRKSGLKWVAPLEQPAYKTSDKSSDLHGRFVHGTDVFLGTAWVSSRTVIACGNRRQITCLRVTEKSYYNVAKRSVEPM